MNERASEKRKRETKSGARPNRFTPSLLAVMVMHTVHMCVRMHPPSLSRSLARPRAMHSTCGANTHARTTLFLSFFLSSFLSRRTHTTHVRTRTHNARARARNHTRTHARTRCHTSYTVEKRNLIRLSRLSSREERTENLRTRGKNTRETRTTGSKRWRRILSRSLSLSFSFSSARRSRFDREIRNVRPRDDNDQRHEWTSVPG